MIYSVINVCKEINFDFISNEAITRGLLYNDGIRLIDGGTDVLAGNFIDYIENFISYMENVDYGRL